MKSTLIIAALLFLTSLGAADETPKPRRFELVYEAAVNEFPAEAKVVDLWVPIPQSDRNQVIHRVLVDGPLPLSFGYEQIQGNQTLHIKVKSPNEPIRLKVTIEATRHENAGAPAELTPAERVRYLMAEPLVPLEGPVKALAIEATQGLTSDFQKAKSIYEKVTGMMKYDKSGKGWGRGDALFACDAKRGNCTDFHALIIGMCRSLGIPARFAIGLPLPFERGKGEIAGYHCWAEIYLEGRWVPVDSSEAAKRPEKRSYFFGHHDENRLEFSRGRHIDLVPKQAGPSLNFFIYPYAEVDGKPLTTVDRKFGFHDKPTVE